MHVIPELILVFNVLSLVHCKNTKFSGDRFLNMESENGTNLSILRVFIGEYEPYISQRSNADIYHGIEYLLVNTIAEKLNLTVSFQLSTRETLLNHWEPSTRYTRLIFLFAPYLFCVFQFGCCSRWSLFTFAFKRSSKCGYIYTISPG